MSETEIQEWLDDMAGSNGWWHSEAPDALRTILDRLVALGVEPQVAAGIIEGVFGIARGEYGD